MKAFYTVNHDTILKILEGLGAPLKPRSAISRMYQDLKIVLKIGKLEEKMGQTVGERQGDYMDPVLFLFVVMAFAENLEKEWIKAGLQMVTLKQHPHSPRNRGILTDNKKKNFAQGTLLSLFCVLYVEDGAFPLEDHNQITRSLSLIFYHFTRFGLDMHIGRGDKSSKTECVFFPPPGFLKRKRALTIDDGEMDERVIVTRGKQ